MCFTLTAQSKVEIYVSSNDCTKCLSGLTNVLNYFEKNELPMSSLLIVTDYKSMKKKLLSEFNYLNDEMIICDKIRTLNEIPDNRSVCIFISGDKVNMKIALSELNLKNIETFFSPYEYLYPLQIDTLRDTIFESGNFYASGEASNLILFQRTLQVFKLIKFEENNDLSYFDFTIPVEESSFNQAKNIIERNSKINVLDYNASVNVNKEAHLPMMNASSVSVDGNRINIFANRYFYIPENVEDLAHKGFVFLEKFEVGNNILKPNGIFPIVPITKEKNEKYGYFIFYNHQRVDSNIFFSYYNKMTEDPSGKLLDDNYFGCLYSVTSNGMEIIKDFKFRKTLIPDSLQSELKKFSHGNNPKYLQVGDKNFILYKNLGILLDLNTGNVLGINQLIKSILNIETSINPNYIFDFNISLGGFTIVYYDKSKKGTILLSKYKENGVLTSYKIMHEGVIDFLSIEGNIFRIFQKVDDADEFRIGTFVIPD